MQLEAYSWPGNVRELQSVLKQSLLQANGSVLLPDFLPDSVRSGIAGPREDLPLANGTTGTDWDAFVGGRIALGSENLYAESLELMERELLVRVLRHTEGNQVQAARILGITRGSLRNKIRSLNIEIARSIWSENDQPEL